MHGEYMERSTEKLARYGHWEFEDYNENNPAE
jgi:hypothetical protein